MPKSIFETDVEKITSEYNVAEDWQGIMDFCDKLKSTPNGSKEALKCIMKRVNHPIPHVAMQSLTLLAACVDNCGKPFHLEICSREWTNDAKAVILRSHGKVSEKLREMVQKWSETFKEDAQLNLMLHFYKKLKSDGFSFDFAPSASANTPQSSNTQAKDEVSFKEDIDLAIAMSLQESDRGASQVPSSNLYPSVVPSGSSSSAPPPIEEREVCQVRALYDFEAAEDNEMTFKSGEIFSVLDNSDENWWKGRNSKGVGLFPANFVTTDLTEVVEKPPEKKVHFANPETTAEPVKQQRLTINEEHLDLTLSMLKSASPHEIDDEEEAICSMEQKAGDMGNLIDKKVLGCDEKKESLEDLNEKFLQALALYQQLMKEPVNAAPPPMPPSYQVSSSQIHSLPYQQQMFAHNLHQQQFNAPISRGYSSLPPPVTGHQLDSDGAYSSQGPSGLMRQQQLAQTQPQLQQHRQQQQHMQSPHSFSAQTQGTPPGISSSRQPASLPIHNSQLPTSHAPSSLQHEYAQVNYTQQQFPSGQINGTEGGGQFPPQQTEFVNYGYNIPQNTTTYQQTSVYQ